MQYIPDNYDQYKELEAEQNERKHGLPFVTVPNKKKKWKAYEEEERNDIVRTDSRI